MNKNYIIYIVGSFEINAKDEKEAYEAMVKKIQDEKLPVDSWKLVDKASGFVIREQ